MEEKAKLQDNSTKFKREGKRERKIWRRKEHHWGERYA